MKENFGTVVNGLFALYQGISGGMDWGDLVEPLSVGVSRWFEPIFCVYTAFFYFAVLNVVTGVFCNEAISASERDQDHLIREEMNKAHGMVAQFKRVFESADFDGDGCISWEEFKMHQADYRVQALCRYMELEISETRMLFKLLDTDNMGKVPLDRFVMGCLRFRGGAKSLDLAILSYKVERMERELRGSVSSVKDRVTAEVEAQITERLGPRRQLLGSSADADLIRTKVGAFDA